MSAPLVLAMLADARLPVGAHAQSAGLEAAILGGLAAEDVRTYAAARLRTVTLVEAGTAVAARHAWLDAASGAVDRVAGEWAARTPSRPAREAAERLGRGYARLALRLWPRELAPDAALARGCRVDLRYPRPVVLGVIAAATGIAAADLARLVAYDDVQTIAAAALKLLPLDPLDTARWLLDLAPGIAALVEATAAITAPQDIPAGGAPRLDRLIGAHALAPRRLFHA